jgi:hypothetical protein
VSYVVIEIGDLEINWNFYISFSCAFAKFWKGKTSFNMSNHPFFRMEKLGSHWTDFHKIWHLSISLKPVAKTKVSLKSDENNGYFTWKPAYINDNILLNSSYNEKLFNTRHRENKNTNVVVNTFFSETRTVYEIIWKKLWYSHTGHIRQYNTAHALCMLDK